MSDSRNHAWHTIVAGMGSGAISSIVCAPLDVIKLRFQLQGGTDFRRYRGIFSTFKQIHGEEGIRGLFRGLGPSLMTVPLFWGIWWCTYDSCKRALGVQPGDSGRPWQHGLSAICAAALSDVVTQPLWVVRTRTIALVFHSEEKDLLGRNTLGLMRHIVRKEGIAALYRGLSASLLGLSHVAIQLPLYEGLKEQARIQRARRLEKLGRSAMNFQGEAVQSAAAISAHPAAAAAATDTAAAATDTTTATAHAHHPQPQLSVMDVVVASTISKLLASAVTYPHEVVRARLQDSRLPTNLLATARYMYQHEGLAGFYQGMQVSLLRVLPSTVVTFVAYESLVTLLDRL